MHARLVAKRSIDSWLGFLPQQDGIHLLSENSPFAHPEDAYDSQYGHEGDLAIDTVLGRQLLDAAGFVPETVLEVACGTGHLTGALLHDGRVRRLVSSDASQRFLEITKRKMATLPTRDRLDLVRLSDEDFGAVPAGVFDAIMMRSALHHFVDFKGVAATLIGKLKPGGGFFMFEPRADFHILSSLVLKSAKAKALHGDRPWTEAHEHHAKLFIDAADFYLNRTTPNKAYAEDKYAFHLEEIFEIAEMTGTTLKCLGGDAEIPFSVQFRDFMHYCMPMTDDVLADVMTFGADELAFLDRVYEGRPRYAAAEWFLFRAPK